MAEIPTYMIWLIVGALAFALGIGVGCILQGPQTWRPGGKGWRLQQDNRAMREKLEEVGRLVDKHKKAPDPKARGYLLSRF